jgi:hypothetical protein
LPGRGRPDGSWPLLLLFTLAINLGARSGGSGAYDWVWRINYAIKFLRSISAVVAQTGPVFLFAFWPVSSLHQGKIKRSLAKLAYRDRISPGSGVATTRTTVGFTVTLSGNRFLTQSKGREGCSDCDVSVGPNCPILKLFWVSNTYTFASWSAQSSNLEILPLAVLSMVGTTMLRSKTSFVR